ncbi:hypothetical protein HPY31_17125 [Brevibacillus sp. HB1.3]|uniref:hypothetical protein n=1 Tax=Brevibacillus sp. HB1.3 TaxID=2738842 RepID=UPI0015578651|nr:hypothetical protein [Brevibacillus sp. HB1.3]NQF15636.1 hypothetical protein [Brevibacillus sp. HB1.3]
MDKRQIPIIDFVQREGFHTDSCGVWTKNNGENALSDGEETHMIRMQKGENENQLDNHQ